ncbi:GntR family transcriptional regulator [Psychrosphaera sp. F3M07]|uniref:GntR family transcriptional regulator n=1 Tax=Psychrosphaera sp. F3M07 TaxID=2841560 RepID=UPI001C098EEF|nr:GntR family transcriptional regulator [Psychrosphaera sp. F3M07]MBU2919596.1 GntR family transcriptional regulator [Psychrosphaera sp. F3M07]
MTNIKTSMPKYQIIGEQFINRILNGEFSVGDSLPTEKELCEHFKISRHTAREALRYITNTGLVERRQGSGTNVLRTSMPEAINPFIGSVQDLLQHGNATIFKLDKSDVVLLTQQQAELINANQGDTYIQLGGIRHEPHDKKPICYTYIYRKPQQDHVDVGLKDITSAIKTIKETLDSNKIGKVEQTITSILMPELVANKIGSESNSPALQIIRHYYDKGQTNIILVSESIYPAKRFSYSTVLFPE